MHALVTGAAGFIGSHLTEALARDGWTVRAVDCLTDYYDTAQKRANLADVTALDGVTHLDVDLRHADLAQVLDDVDVVFHQAGQPGVRRSWDAFGSYVDHNVLVTQRLLEAARAVPLRRFVFASSSSVYGDATDYPTVETALPRPHSPYGVTKLAAEHLCGLYARNWGVPTVSLRYFTVYGPRQRPDMAMHRIVEAALAGTPFPMFGTGAQVRDFTYVADVVRANLAAAEAAVVPGTVLNVAGGSATTLAEVVATIAELTGQAVLVDEQATEAGDVTRTGGSTDQAARLLGWQPEVPLRQGLAQQVAWHRDRTASTPPLEAQGAS
jgi:UDP-glucuronate 4-epimerase